MISSLQLEAFLAVAAELHFTRAARRLGLTQSALSQRVANLEDGLGVTLLVRDRAGVRLTEEGARLLRHARACERLEEEALADLRPSTGGLAGSLRIAGYSSIVRSVLAPALSDLVRDHAGVQIQLLARELRELPAMLQRGEVDLIVLDHELTRRGLEHRVLGHEENVLVAAERARDGWYLDHDPDDTTTEAFFGLQRRVPATMRRCYLDDIYGLLDAAIAGWGRAVIPRHLARTAPSLRVVRGLKPLVTPVVLHFHAQPFYPSLHVAAVAALEHECSRLLSC